MKPGAGQGSPLRVALLYRAILVKIITSSRASCPTPRLPYHRGRLPALSQQGEGAPRRGKNSGPGVEEHRLRFLMGVVADGLTGGGRFGGGGVTAVVGRGERRIF